VPLHVFDWRPKHETAGLARDALYLMRPDTYVAVADASGVPDILDRYCAERGLQLGGTSLRLNQRTMEEPVC
jgi:hypothetical protein